MKYDNYIEYMECIDWKRETKIVDNTSDIVNITSRKYDNAYTITIDILTPKGTKMSIRGKEYTEDKNAYMIGLYITNEDNKEIPDNTLIRLVKDEPCVTLDNLLSIHYSDVKMKDGKCQYVFKNGCEFTDKEHLYIYITSSINNIILKDIKFKMKVDIWKAK